MKTELNVESWERLAVLGQWKVIYFVKKIKTLLLTKLELKKIYSSSDFEKKVIQAVAQIQKETNSPITFHPGRNPKSPFEILRVFTEAGGIAEDVVMSHLDRNF